MKKLIFTLVIVLNVAFAFSQPIKDVFRQKSEEIIAHFKLRQYDSITPFFAEEKKPSNGRNALASFYEPLAEKYGDFETFRLGGSKQFANQINIEYIVKTKFNIDILVNFIFYTEEKKLIFYRFDETFKTYAIPEYADAEKYIEQNIVFSYDSLLPLKGILTYPIGEKKPPLVIIIPAAGPTDADGNFVSKPYVDLATGLATKGYAVFRYNKRSLSHGYSFMALNPLNKPFTPKEDVLDDLQAAINLFSKSNTIDTSKIFLLGHGEGAYWAPYVANVNKNIKGIILMGANANHPLEMMIDQNNYLSKILPHKKEHYDEDNQKAKIVLKRKIKENTPASDLPHDIPAKYWFFVNSYDQVKVAKRLKTPIFIIQGGRDYQVDKKNFFVWQKKLKNKSNVSFKLYQNMNHIMHEGVGESTYSEYSIMRHIPALVIDDLVSWLNKN